MALLDTVPFRGEEIRWGDDVIPASFTFIHLRHLAMGLLLCLFDALFTFLLYSKAGPTRLSHATFLHSFWSSGVKMRGGRGAIVLRMLVVGCGLWVVGWSWGSCYFSVLGAGEGIAK